MGRETRYRLLAWVCGHDCVRYIDDEASSTFQRIFISRPDGCRYAVLSRWSVPRHDDEVLVLDMYAAEQLSSGGLVAPEPIRVCEDLDAAIMATAMLYEDR